ncbi:MAG: AAA family ATPase [Marinilabiliaceae bacterium]|nr:AAA family ATPase [Marinilabiliaceae bacterium]
MESILDYKINELIYSGNESVIFRAENNKGSFILKLLNDGQLNSFRLSRFKKEFSVIQKMKSDFVRSAHDFFKYDDSYVMVLEDLGGVSLKEFVLKYGPPSSVDELMQCLDVAISIVQAIIFIHSNDVTHCNVSSANFIINPDSKDVKLIDFGFARTDNNLGYEVQEILEDTNLPYISPEQTGRFNRKVDYRTDFYSVGVTLYELFTGRLPFVANNVREWVYCHIAMEPFPLLSSSKLIPKPLSDIILKMMDKEPDNRYQSGYGIFKDLSVLREAIINGDELNTFELGKFDISDKIKIPSVIFGREKELSELVSSFENIKIRDCDFVLIKGKTGVGKSSLLWELQRVIIEKKGYIAKGSFDQLKSNVPYSALNEAFRGVIRALLTESDIEIENWRNRFMSNLGSNARLIVNAIPELESIIGKQTDITELPPLESQSRFYNAFLKFIKVFSDEDKVLVLLLDNLNWADSASLEIIKNLLLNPLSGSLLIVSSLNDDVEINEKSVLADFFFQLQESGVCYKEVLLSELSQEAIYDLISGTLPMNDQDTKRLVELCFLKTKGNPYFIVEFLNELYIKKLVWFNFDLEKWVCKFDEIASLDVADNVADFIIKKVHELPSDIQDVLRFASCIGVQFNADLISMAMKISWTDLEAKLNVACEGLFICSINETDSSVKYIEGVKAYYKFFHDRVRQEIYNTIPEADRNKIHKEIGNYLLTYFYYIDNKDQLFSILEHLNKGIEYFNSKEKKLLAEFNLRACKAAKADGAFGLALNYILVSKNISDELPWQMSKDVSFDIYYHLCETYFLCGDFVQMEQSIELALGFVSDVKQRSKVIGVRIQSLFVQHKQPEAVASAIELLNQLGVVFPQKPGYFKLIFQLLFVLLNVRKVKSVSDFKLNTYSDSLEESAMNLMAKILSASFYVSPVIFSLLIFKMIRNTLKYGLFQKSPVAFVTFGLLLYSLNFKVKGFFWSQLGMKLFQRINADDNWAQSATIYNSGLIWKESIRKSIKGFSDAFTSAMSYGDIEYAGASVSAAITYRFYAGFELNSLFEDALKQNSFLNFQKLNLHVGQTSIILQTIDNLKQGGDRPEVLLGDYYNENEWLEMFLSRKDYVSAANLYTQKIILAFIFNKYEVSLSFVEQSKRFVIDAKNILQYAMYNFYYCLALLANESGKRNFWGVSRQVRIIYQKFKVWAKQCPDNFENKFLLIKAEIARINGNVLQAVDLYDRSIACANKQELLCEQAIANELAGRFWLDLEKYEFAGYYYQKAYKLFDIWGATKKADELFNQFSKFFKHDNTNDSSLMFRAKRGVNDKVVDIETILEAAHAISGEIQYSKLVEKSLKIIMEYLGAQLGVFIRNDIDLKIEAIGRVDKDKLLIQQVDFPVTNKYVPKNFIFHVKQTQTIAIIKNACEITDNHSDFYFTENKVKSVLAIPIIHQAKFIGLFYFENNFSSDLFNNELTKIASVLCNQVAISIENALLYNSLELKVKERTIELQNKNKLLLEKNEEIEKARNELKKSNATKDKFFSIIAHDLRGPIGNIDTFFDLLAERIQENDFSGIEKLVANYNKISKNTFRLLVNLLEWARSQKGEIEHDPILQSVNALILSNIDMVEAKSKLRNIRIESKLCKDCFAFFDKNQIDTVLRNLLDNALKYVDDGGIIEVECCRQGQNVVVSVSDNGIGMSEKDKETLFDNAIFPKSKPGVKGDKGTGLGLMLCKEFVLKNGGDIWVESQNECGCTFLFTIPCSSPEG